MIATLSPEPDRRVMVDQIPESLRSMPRWVCWKYMPNPKGGKDKKLPIHPISGEAADSTDPKTWTTFEDAASALEGRQDLAGLMFALGPDVGVMGIDLDQCIDAAGTFTPEAKTLIETFDTYTEVSPSGTGVKIFLLGKKPGKDCRKKNVHGCHEIEIYEGKRFFTVTGRRLHEVSPEVEDRQVELDDLHAELFPPKSNHPRKGNAGGRGSMGQGFTGEDGDLLDKARSAANGGVFTRLYDAGDTSAHDGDDSAADLALVSMLAFWAGPDADRIDRLFRGSGLMREKWDERRGQGTYGRQTIEKALEGKTDFYGGGTARVSATGAPLPDVELGPDEHRVIDEVVAAMAGDPDLYQRGGQLVRVIWVADGTDGHPTLREVEPPTLREFITRNVCLLKPDKKGDWIPAHPPGWLVTGVQSRGEWPGVRTLTAISRSPVLRPDGSVVQIPGYDERTHVLYLPGGEFPIIHDDANLDDALDAMERILEVVRDFPFASAEHRSAWLAGLLTLAARHAFIGNAPMFLIDANVRGAGKTLLAQVAGRIALGCDVPVSTYSHEPGEMRKAFTAMVIAAEPMVLLDNLSGSFGNDVIDRAVTSQRWCDRVLSTNTQVDLPMTTVIWATGNNVTVQGDTTRRIVHIRLDSTLERPEDRGDFVHKDILAHVAQHRASLYADAITILAAFKRAGCPLPSDLRPFGSFEGWSRLVRGAVIWLGLPDPCSTRDGLEVAADTEKELLLDLLDALDAHDPNGEGVVVATLMTELYPGLNPPSDATSVALRVAIEAVTNCLPGKVPTARQVGSRFKRLRDRVVGGRKLTSRPGEKRSGGVVWRVVWQEGSDGQ